MSIARLLKSSAPAAPSLRYSSISFIGTLLAIGITGWLSHVSGTPWLMASFGASCVLAFGVPESPLAQPRSIIGGHILSTLIGLVLLNTLGNAWWVGALGVALALFAMQQLRCVHAPAGANPLVVIASGAAWGYLFSPVLLGSLVIVALACVVNNARKRNSYPQYWL